MRKDIVTHPAGDSPGFYSFRYAEHLCSLASLILTHNWRHLRGHVCCPHHLRSQQCCTYHVQCHHTQRIPHLLSEWKRAVWRELDSPFASKGEQRRHLFCPREEAARVSLTEECCQLQTGPAKPQEKLMLCVRTRNRGKLLVNSFQQNIWAGLVKILYTPCSCSECSPRALGLPTRPNSSGSLQ